MSYVSFGSSGHDIVRDAHAASRSDGDTFLVSLQVAGNALISQGDQRVCLAPGEMSIVEGWRPFSVSLEGEVSRRLAIVPRRMLSVRAVRPGVLRAVHNTAPFADLLRQYILRLSDPRTDIPGNVAETLGENICNLLGVICAGEEGPERSSAAVRRAALMAYIRAHISEPDLNPAKAAAHLGIAVRTLHKLLEAHGETFGALVLELRLHSCARCLRDRAFAEHGIADIAYAWGFGDLSHFNHAFKARFGMTPSEMRTVE